MRIFQIGSNNMIKQNNNCFKGIFGEKHLTKTDGLHYEVPYYPFKDEDNLSIRENLLKYTYSEPVDNNESIYWEYEAYIAATLPILTADYKLFKEGKLSNNASKIIEKTIKTIVK